MLVSMIEDDAVDGVTHFVEIVHVKLPHEGVVVAVLEVLG